MCIDIVEIRFGIANGQISSILDDWLSVRYVFDSRQVDNILSWRFDQEIFSMVILSLLLIEEGQLSVSGERVCTVLVNSLASKSVVR